MKEARETTKTTVDTTNSKTLLMGRPHEAVGTITSPHVSREAMPRITTDPNNRATTTMSGTMRAERTTPNSITARVASQEANAHSRTSQSKPTTKTTTIARSNIPPCKNKDVPTLLPSTITITSSGLTTATIITNRSMRQMVQRLHTGHAEMAP